MSPWLRGPVCPRSLLDLNATVNKNVRAPSIAGAPTSVTERSPIARGEDGPGDALVAVPEQELVPLALLFVARQPRAALALDVKVILTQHCVFH